MINISALNIEEKTLLVELIKFSKISENWNSITVDTLGALKPNVLEVALDSIKPKFKPENYDVYRVLKEIIDKISRPTLENGEILIPKENRLTYQ